MSYMGNTLCDVLEFGQSLWFDSMRRALIGSGSLRRLIDQDGIQDILGKVAIANAKITYQRYKELFGSPRWQKLAARGAQTQRLLWASTGKNPRVPRCVLHGGAHRPGHREHGAARHAGRLPRHAQIPICLPAHPAL